MRCLLVAPEDRIRLFGISAAMFGMGMAGDMIAGWVRERGVPSDPIPGTCLPARAAPGTLGSDYWVALLHAHKFPGLLLLHALRESQAPACVAFLTRHDSPPCLMDTENV